MTGEHFQCQVTAASKVGKQVCGCRKISPFDGYIDPSFRRTFPPLLVRTCISNCLAPFGGFLLGLYKPLSLLFLPFPLSCHQMLNSLSQHYRALPGRSCFLNLGSSFSIPTSAGQILHSKLMNILRLKIYILELISSVAQYPQSFLWRIDAIKSWAVYMDTGYRSLQFTFRGPNIHLER